MSAQSPANHEFGRLPPGKLLISEQWVEAAQLFAAGVRREPRRAVPAIAAPSRPRPPDLGYFAARQLFSDLGVPFLRAAEVRDVEVAVTAAGSVGFSVCLKALGTLHKSDVGGVVLRIRNKSQLRDRYKHLTRDCDRRLSA